MAVVREDDRIVTSRFIDQHYGGRSVLLAFRGNNFPIGQGYLAYSSDASTPEDARADQLRLEDLLFSEFDLDGTITSGWTEVDNLCTLSL